MLTGKLPFQGEAFGVVQAIISAHVEIPEGAHLPPPVEAFLLSCLDKDPLNRPLNGTVAASELAHLRTSLTGFPTVFATARPAAPSLATPSPAPWPKFATESKTPQSPHPADIHPPARTPVSASVLLASAAAVALAAVVLFLSRYSRIHPGPWIGVALGVGLALGGMILGHAIQSRLAARRRTISIEAQDILTGARAKKRLSQTLAFQVDQLMEKCRVADEKFLAASMAVMVEEFRSATVFDDRQKALMNAVTLLDKLMPKLSPWYVRHDKLVGFAVTIVGILSGLAAVAENLAKLLKGQ